MALSPFRAEAKCGDDLPASGRPERLFWLLVSLRQMGLELSSPEFLILQYECHSLPTPMLFPGPQTWMILLASPLTLPIMALGISGLLRMPYSRASATRKLRRQHRTNFAAMEPTPYPQQDGKHQGKT